MGASKSDAVRDIYIGTLDAFPAQNFPPADYIALGRIHRAQIIRRHGTCFSYCGSPIPLSFDECGKSKYVHLVTFSTGKLESVENLNVPVTQPMAVLKGDLASLPHSWNSGAMYRRSHLSGWISKSLLMSICMIFSAKSRH